jgi:membrane-bound lytic murein transglycosylase D
MTPTGFARHSVKRFLAIHALGFVLGASFLVEARAAQDPLPRPAELERDVQFWIRVYSQISTNEGYLHDERHLGVVYETLRFAPYNSPRERQRSVDEKRERIQKALRKLASGAEPANDEERRIRELWGEEGTPARLLAAVHEIRFQLGQSDRFRAGLERSGTWETHIAETLATMGLPAQIAALPHVESSFNPAAYSKVGAAGLWQFMRSTGRRYMRIDSAVDERMDPFRATEAAAQLLAYNYRVLGSWPLALTAYNHGAAGMRRAKQAMGTDDIAKIVRHHRSPSFGFASRNFYVSFLAALEIDRNPEKYFGGGFTRAPEGRFREIAVPAYVPVAALERATQIPRAQLQALNPALRPPVWSGQRLVPRGYKLRLPGDADGWTTELLAQRLQPNELFDGQTESRAHKVRRGETLAAIAERYGTSVAELAELNDMSPQARLRAGRLLSVPRREPRMVAKTGVVAAVAAGSTGMAGVASAPPSGTPVAAADAGAGVYVVRRGDALSEIATRVGVPEAELLRINRIRNPNFIYEGQRLRLKPEEAAPAVAVVADAPEIAPAASSGGTIEAPSASSDAAAGQLVAESPTSGPIRRVVRRSEPVSKAQAEAIGPSLAPDPGAPAAADFIDLTVRQDGTIEVAAAETLGHYAEWLGVSAARLREVNGIRYGKPVLIGRRIKLDFSRVAREKFEERRRQYHSQLQTDYFAAHRIVGTEIYIVRRGDSLWSVAQRYSRLPVWLIQQYNPDLDLGDMRLGVELVVPRVEQVAGPAS